MRIYTLEELETASTLFLDRVQIYNPIQASIYQNQINLGCRFNDVMKLAKWQDMNAIRHFRTVFTFVMSIHRYYFASSCAKTS